MRSFAKICVEVQDGGDLAKRLERVLNEEVAILDPERMQVYKPKERQREDYQTIHPGVIGQPDFNFLPAGLKMARIDSYHRLKNELEKTREIREML